MCVLIYLHTYQHLYTHHSKSNWNFWFLHIFQIKDEVFIPHQYMHYYSYVNFSKIHLIILYPLLSFPQRFKVLFLLFSPFIHFVAFFSGSHTLFVVLSRNHRPDYNAHILVLEAHGGGVFLATVSTYIFQL